MSYVLKRVLASLSNFYVFVIQCFCGAANVVEKKPKKKTSKKKTAKETKAPSNEVAAPVPIRPIRRIRPETSWQSGKDL